MLFRLIFFATWSHVLIYLFQGEEIYRKHNNIKYADMTWLKCVNNILIFNSHMSNPNLIKIRFLTCSRLLLRRTHVLRKSHYRSHASEHMNHPNENGNCETMKMSLNCFACYEQSSWPKKGHNLIYHIIIYSWYKVTHMWGAFYQQMRLFKTFQ